ncbi:MAG: cobalt-precorrin-5B (C(1))-methyltransferase CbiD [Cyanobacteriota bacterium]|nr:cobalt-precorrin-5B (C(1))-methyltransferase CbiD [Cyanobacteriota bacterium]
MPRPGYTLPVFASAAAVAALRHLQQYETRQDKATQPSVAIDLLDPPETVKIPIESVAALKPGTALAVSRSDPGDNLDLTRNTPIWALVEILASTDDKRDGNPEEAIEIVGGEGLGRNTQTGEAAVYAYARRLLRSNLMRYLEAGDRIRATIILPEGRSLALRTSNAAFGIVEGLSLLGTTGISQPLSAPGQLEAYREELRAKSRQFDDLVFCIGESGLNLARNLGVPPDRLIKVANWIGPLLVEAGLQKLQSILLFGYHGKSIKLAGGIFHTHHHLADGRAEILTAHCANLGLPSSVLREIFESATAEDALECLQKLDAQTHSNSVMRVYSSISATIDRRARDYIQKHSQAEVEVGSILFDRQRQIIVKSEIGADILDRICS